MNDEQLYELYRRVCKHYEERGEDLNKREFIQHKHELISAEVPVGFYEDGYDGNADAFATAMFYFVTALAGGYSSCMPNENWLDMFGRLLVRLKLEESNEQ